MGSQFGQPASFIRRLAPPAPAPPPPTHLAFWSPGIQALPARLPLLPYGDRAAAAGRQPGSGRRVTGRAHRRRAPAARHHRAAASSRAAGHRHHRRTGFSPGSAASLALRSLALHRRHRPAARALISFPDHRHALDLAGPPVGCFPVCTSCCSTGPGARPAASPAPSAASPLHRPHSVTRLASSARHRGAAAGRPGCAGRAGSAASVHRHRTTHRAPGLGR